MLLRRTLSLAALAAALITSVASADPPATGTLRVDVSSFKNKSGFLGCRLFAQSSGFPDGAGAANLKQPIAGTTASCTFENVAPGTYAVAVIHDENSNGRLDKSFFGVPTEGYGVSNNHTYGMSSPKWDESRFTVAAGESKTLNVSLRY